MFHQLPIPTLQPFVRMVSDEQVRELHYATLEILRKTGVKMQDPQGRDLLLEAGAWESGERIKIPENMVTDAIDKAPSRIPMHDRLGNLRMPLELGKVFFGSGSDTTFTLDPETGKRRRSVAQDVRNMATVGDALENIDFIMSMANPSDVPPDDLYLHAFINMIRGSVKPNVYTAKDRKDMEDIYRVAVSVAGGETELREKPFYCTTPNRFPPCISSRNLYKSISSAPRRASRQPISLLPTRAAAGRSPWPGRWP
jgi:trimethylamine---corrinoid protein Co-methyltransferase